MSTYQTNNQIFEIFAVIAGRLSRIEWDNQNETGAVGDRCLVRIYHYMTSVCPKLFA